MKIFNFIFNLYINFLITVGIFFGLLKWEYSPNKKKLKARTRYLWEAAQKRGIALAVLKTPRGYSNLCLARKGKKKILFETLPSHRTYRIDPEKIDNKFFFKKFLSKLGLPVPEGQKFLTLRAARKYAKVIGYPVVVKPVARSIFQGVTLDIKNDTELQSAISEAKKFQSTFLVEKFIAGQSFRIMIVGEQIFASLRQPAFVRGDGRSTIRQLMRKRNQHKWRGPVGVDGWTLRQIDPAEVKKFLVKSNLNFKYKPKKNEVIKLTDKINLAGGADVYDCTDKIHPRNIEKFQKIARLLQTPIVGLDVIMDDIARPWNQQTFYLIEANTIPSIDMHHRPLKGRVRDVAGEVWDLLTSKKIL